MSSAVIKYKSLVTTNQAGFLLHDEGMRNRARDAE